MPDGPTPAALDRPGAGAAFDCRIAWGKGTGGCAPGGLPLTFRFSRPGGGEPPASSGWPRLAAGNPHPRHPGTIPGPCAALSWARLSVSPAPPSPDSCDVPIIPRRHAPVDFLAMRIPRSEGHLPWNQGGLPDLASESRMLGPHAPPSLGSMAALVVATFSTPAPAAVSSTEILEAYRRDAFPTGLRASVRQRRGFRSM